MRRSVAAGPPRGLIFHSDRGSEFLGSTFRARLAAAGVQQSMTRGGAPGENAHMESFFHSLKADVIHGRVFHTVAELRQHLRRYVRYYNHQRLHSSLGYQSMKAQPRRTSPVYRIPRLQPRVVHFSFFMSCNFSAKYSQKSRISPAIVSSPVARSNVFAIDTNV